MPKVAMRLAVLFALTLCCTLPAFASHEELYVLDGPSLHMVDIETGFTLDTLLFDADVRSVGFSVEGEFAYVLLADGTVVVIRTDTARVAATIPPDGSPAAAHLAVPTGNRRAVWVANDAPEIVVRDARSFAVSARLELPEPAAAIRFSFDNHWAFVVLPKARQIVAYDATTFAEVARVPLAGDPQSLQVVRSGTEAGHVVVATSTGVERFSATLTPVAGIDLESGAVLATPVGTAGAFLLWLEDGHLAWVDAIPGQARLSANPLGGVVHLAATADSGRAYAAMEHGEVIAIDLDSLNRLEVIRQAEAPLRVVVKTTIRACF